MSGARTAHALDRQGGREKLRLRQLARTMSGLRGQIFAIEADDGRVAKVYHDRHYARAQRPRLEAMLAAPPDLPPIAHGGRDHVQIAWPDAILLDRFRRPIGFRMPHVQATASLLQLLSATERRRLRPAVSPARLLSAAFNLCVIVAELHRVGHRLVDLKPLNFLVETATMFIAAVDCDGYHVNGPGGQAFPADAYSDEYRCPEGASSTPDRLGLSEAQDRFALAVILFQLLADGWHPYSGVPAHDGVPSPLQARIDQGFYPYGRTAHPAIRPAPLCPIRQLDPETRTLLDRAFLTTDRPAAAEWRDHAMDLRRRAQAPPAPIPPAPLLAPGSGWATTGAALALAASIAVSTTLPPTGPPAGRMPAAVAPSPESEARAVPPRQPPTGPPRSAPESPPGNETTAPPELDAIEPAAPPPAPPSGPLAHDDVRALQEGLRALGFDPGPADGIVGRRTQAAFLAFTGDDSRLPESDRIDATAAALVTEALLGRRLLQEAFAESASVQLRQGMDVGDLRMTARLARDLAARDGEPSTLATLNPRTSRRISLERLEGPAEVMPPGCAMLRIAIDIFRESRPVRFCRDEVP